jgi:SAM-dependent methyltransferase
MNWENKGQNWFKDWFNSDYYHLLYSDRDGQEAEKFLDRFFLHWPVPDHSAVLDLGCGKGRHALYLSQRNLKVTGIDLSEESIKYASAFSSDNLSFYVHDMRLPFRVQYFDWVFNLFTSFGYFDSDEEHVQTLQNINLNLKEGGVLLLDYLNSDKTIHTLTPFNTVKKGDVSFFLSRNYDKGIIYKRIDIETPGATFFHVEKVRAFTLEDFQKMFERAGMEIVKYYGDYHFGPYDPLHSDRLILIVKKVKNLSFAK